MPIPPDVFLTNTRKCLPPEVEDKEDQRKSIDHCIAAYLDKEIEAFGSEVAHVHCMGAEGAYAVAGFTGIARIHGSVLNRSELVAIRQAEAVKEEEEEDDQDAAAEVA